MQPLPSILMEIFKCWGNRCDELPEPFVMIAQGKEHGCGIIEDAKICWGDENVLKIFRVEILFRWL